ncbi:MAG: SelT/SelW/SelH family protein [Candidatus Marinimicrobia bacterium]|nr:SelT/SelW/SelH family protein [Candidatus Neomarinimicrobiota bacterium]
MANELLEKYGTKITQLTMMPSDGGVYEIIKDGRLIFSKMKLDRFPDNGEIVTLIENS